MSEEVAEYVTAAVKECVTAAVCTAMKTGIVEEYVTAAVKEYVTAAVNECVAAAVYAAMRETSTTTTITKIKRKKLTPRSRATNEDYPHRPKRRRYARDESSGQVAGPQNTQDEDSPHRPVKRFKSSDEEYDDDVFDGISSGDLLSMCPLAESPTSTPGTSVKATSFSDMPLDIILLIANRTDMVTLNSLSRTCKGFSVFLRWHRGKDTQLLRAVERGDLPEIETIFRSPLATARGGLGLLAKVVKDHTNYIDLVNAEFRPCVFSQATREALIECFRERLSRTVALVRVLLEAGAEIDGCDKRGFTALHWATRCHDIGNTGFDLVRLLLDFGADVNSLGTVGLTPLHAALCPYPNREIINSLIEAGANVNSKDKYGLTPLHVAALNVRGTLVFRVLEDAGAVINIDGSRGYQLAPICSESCFYHYHDSSCEVPLDDRINFQRDYGGPGNLWLPEYSEFCHVTVPGER